MNDIITATFDKTPPANANLRPSGARVARVIDGLGISWEEQDYTPEAAVKLFRDAIRFAHIAKDGTCCAEHQSDLDDFNETEAALMKMGYINDNQLD